MILRPCRIALGCIDISVRFRGACSARRLSLLCAGALLWISVLAIPSRAEINHGDFMGNTVTYLMVTEEVNSPPPDSLPLFGVPSVFGDSLDFNPVGFAASNSGGGAPDITDGQLTFMVEAKDKQTQGIFNIKFDEFGDTTLSGSGDDATRTIVTCAIFVDIVELNIGGVVQTITPVKIQTTMAFTPHDGEYLLGTHGGGTFFNTLWSGTELVDLQAEIVNAGFSASDRITKINVNLDNTLTAISQADTSAIIAKKDHFIITTNIPEPASGALAALAMMFVASVARRSRQ